MIALAIDVALRVSGRGGFPFVVTTYLAMSAVTFAVYAFDKARARAHRRRVPELTLHLLGLAGGWPGALAAIPALHHKSRKARFLLVVAATVLLHAAGWAWWVWR